MPCNIKQAALNVCMDQATLIVNGDPTAWVLADKIERRWRIIGATQSQVDALNRKRAEFLKQESARHDMANPDRLTYLHR